MVKIEKMIKPDLGNLSVIILGEIDKKRKKILYFYIIPKVDTIFSFNYNDNPNKENKLLDNIKYSITHNDNQNNTYNTVIKEVLENNIFYYNKIYNTKKYGILLIDKQINDELTNISKDSVKNIFYDNIPNDFADVIIQDYITNIPERDIPAYIENIKKGGNYNKGYKVYNDRNKYYINYNNKKYYLKSTNTYKKGNKYYLFLYNKEIYV